jgi:hypothetical protein
MVFHLYIVLDSVRYGLLLRQLPAMCAMYQQTQHYRNVRWYHAVHTTRLFVKTTFSSVKSLVILLNKHT